jgi:hypothetical protein
MENAKFQTLLINLTEKKKNSKLQLEPAGSTLFFNGFLKLAVTFEGNDCPEAASGSFGEI